MRQAQLLLSLRQGSSTKTRHVLPLCQPHPLTFPCISIRSVRVMLSSGSSSSPASELLILSGGAGATAAWECVHAVAQLALDGTEENRV